MLDVLLFISLTQRSALWELLNSYAPVFSTAIADLSTDGLFISIKDRMRNTSSFRHRSHTDLNLDKMKTHVSSMATRNSSANEPSTKAHAFLWVLDSARKETILCFCATS